ncbi:MAG: hypothetical protein ACI84K_000708, partial [Pseudohongiellaceae bacterium]
QNILRDVDAYLPVESKVVRYLIFQQIREGSASFFHSQDRGRADIISITLYVSDS